MSLQKSSTNSSTYLKKSKKSSRRKHESFPRGRPKITLLFPYRAGNPHRDAAFRWLLKYYKHELPEAEIVIGKSREKLFCKTEAFNNGFKKATGEVIVLMDSDAYIKGEVITRCADRILENKEDHLWYVPYRRLFRLTNEVTEKVIASDPADPMRMPVPLPKEWIDGNQSTSSYGHRYGAMMMIVPREAIEILGCFDERFKGWGGEDIAILRALDTLYGKHKTTKNPIYHLWHPTKGTNYRDRTWQGQSKKHMNDRLGEAYHRATRNPSRMRKLVDEGCAYRNRGWYVKIKEILKIIWEYLNQPWGKK